MTPHGPSPSQDDLALLLAGVLAGDEPSFCELYELTHVRVAGVVNATLRSPQHAAEVVQEVYLHVWLNPWTYDPGRGSVQSWLAMLARRRAIDRVRHVVRMQRRELRSAVTADHVEPDVAELGVARCEAARLHGALEQLTALQRDAVVLTFLDGYTHEQAARLLRIPLGTLKTRVRTGVGRLRHHLAAQAA